MKLIEIDYDRKIINVYPKGLYFIILLFLSIFILSLR